MSSCTMFVSMGHESARAGPRLCVSEGQDMVYTGVQHVTVGSDETIVEAHDAHQGACALRLTPMAVQELLEALGRALVRIRGADPALARPLYTITEWNPMMNGLHEHALLLTTSEGLEFAVALDADLRAQLRAHLALLDAAALVASVH